MSDIATYLDPSGVLRQPVLLTGPGERLYGTDPENPYGRRVIVGGEFPAVLIGPAEGKGYPYPVVVPDNQGNDWLQLREDLTQWWDLSDCPMWDLNGLTALTVECQLTADALPGAPRYLICSQGREFSTPDSPVTQALAIYFVGGVAYFSVTTTAGTFTVQSSQMFSAGVPAMLKCNLGAGTMRIFVNGQLNSFVAVPGTIVQQPWEWVCLSGMGYDWHSGWEFGGFPGKLRGLRLSDAQGERFYLDGSQVYGPFLKYRARSAAVGYLMSRSDLDAQKGQTDCEVADVEFTGPVAGKSGVLAVGGVACSVKNVKVDGCRYGVSLTNNSYTARVENVWALGGPYGRAGVVNTMASGVQDFRQLRLEGFPYGMALGVGSVVAEEVYIDPVKCGIWASAPTDPGTVLTLIGATVATESNPGTEALAAANPKAILWHGGSWGVGSTPVRLRGVPGVVSLQGIDSRFPGPAQVDTAGMVDGEGVPFEVDTSGIAAAAV